MLCINVAYLGCFSGRTYKEKAVKMCCEETSRSVLQEANFLKFDTVKRGSRELPNQENVLGIREFRFRDLLSVNISRRNPSRAS